MVIDKVGSVHRACDKCHSDKECDVVLGKDGGSILLCADCQENLDLNTAEEEIFGDDCRAVADSMMEFGGDFEKALGHALLMADAINARKIRRTWPEYWEKYLGFSEHKGGEKK